MVELNRAQRVPHLLRNGTSKIVVTLPDVYGEIGSTVGVEKLTGDIPGGAGGGDVADLMKLGQAIKIKISYKVAGKRKTADVICSVDNIKTAMPALASKTFNGGNIIKAYFPRRRRLS
ncbi:hypothetical protein H6G27_09915 [Nostoc linckia FACHB-104]|nr:hypothetical protein [Nostoc linckia FACHB-104]